MKLQLNAGDWATIALFALGTLLGCYAEGERDAKAGMSTSTTAATRSTSMRSAAVAVELE